MRSLVTAVLLGLGALAVTAASPQQAEAGPWRHRGYYAGYYAPSYYYGPSVAYVDPYAVSGYVAPVYVAPSYYGPAYYGSGYVAPSVSLSIGPSGWGYPGWYGGYRGGYYRRW